MKVIRNILKNLTLNITDGEHGSVEDELDGKYFLLSNKNLISGSIIYNEDDRKISEMSFNKIKKRTKLAKNDILISTVGTIGKVAIVKDANINYDFQRSVGIIKCDSEKLLPEYLFYYLSLDFVQKRLNTLSKGAVQKCLFIGDLNDLEIDYPECIHHQRRIVENLISIRNKIDLNYKINSELEEIAKTLYDYWFVQFDFPNEEGKPYKSSGGAMEWNEELKREIPVGWEVQNVKENKLSQLIGVGIDKFEGIKDYLATADVNDNVISQNVESITFLERPSRANMQPVENSIWFAKMKNSKKVLYFGEYSKKFIEKYILSTGFAGIKCNKDYYLEYLWSYVNNRNFEILKDKLSTGATQEAINNERMEFLKLVIPEETILINFSKKTKEIYNKIYLNQLENQELASLRDWLLPMLMNGQVSVK